MGFDQLSAMFMAQEKGSFEPQRQTNFALELYLHEVITEGSAQNLITMALQTGFAPVHDNAEVELPYGNSSVWVAGKRTWEAGVFSVKDSVDRLQAMMLAKWSNKVQDYETDDINFASEYKVAGAIVMYAPNRTRSRQWRLVGCWPKMVNWGTYDMTAGDAIVTIEVTMRYDKAIPVDFLQVKLGS